MENNTPFQKALGWNYQYKYQILKTPIYRKKSCPFRLRLAPSWDLVLKHYKNLSDIVEAKIESTNTKHVQESGSLKLLFSFLSLFSVCLLRIPPRATSQSRTTPSPSTVPPHSSTSHMSQIRTTPSPTTVPSHSSTSHVTDYHSTTAFLHKSHHRLRLHPPPRQYHCILPQATSD